MSVKWMALIFSRAGQMRESGFPTAVCVWGSVEEGEDTVQMANNGKQEEWNELNPSECK